MEVFEHEIPWQQGHAIVVGRDRAALIQAARHPAGLLARRLPVSQQHIHPESEEKAL